MENNSSQQGRDDLLRGYHDVPRDENLKSMSDIELDSLLCSSKDNPVKSASIEREIQRRKLGSSSPPKPKPSLWFHPLMKLVLYIVGVVGAAAILFFLGLKK